MITSGGSFDLVQNCLLSNSDYFLTALDFVHNIVGLLRILHMYLFHNVVFDEVPSGHFVLGILAFFQAEEVS